MAEEVNGWWTTLQHEGVLVSPLVLEEIFPDGPEELQQGVFDSLRKRYRRFRKDPDALYSWLDTVLETTLGFPASRWEKETQVSSKWKTDRARPHRVLLDDPDAEDPDAQMLVLIDKDRVVDDDGNPGRIGIYSGRKKHADLVKLLRETGTPLGLLTNGHRFRLVHASLDTEHWSEWDATAWFQGGEGRDSLQGFAGLLNKEMVDMPEDAEAGLLHRIRESRNRQADLSGVMGEQVREAVELLLRELDDLLQQMPRDERERVLEPLRELDLGTREELRARFQAGIRIVMRLVVTLYAESRNLFPKQNPIYLESYSVEHLFKELREARIDEGDEELAKRYSAWPRLMALFRLVHEGSPHKDVPMHAYGGKLFRPPKEGTRDSVLAALSMFEHPAVRVSDAVVHDVLEKLKIAKFKSGGSWRTGPVDFSDLRTEYIGMMYEGLLDYDLREATEDDGGIVFLNVGDQPALPFRVLESLDDDGIKKLISNLKSGKTKSEFLQEAEVDEDEVEEAEEENEAAEDVVDEVLLADEEDTEEVDELRARVHKWARKVVRLTNTYMPHANTVRAMDPTTKEKYVDQAAHKLVDRLVPPGGTYLVSWSGTRKSTGTFYTPPGLAIPTVHRTLEPLAYHVPDENEEDAVKTPKRPEEILDLQVCDPAMGSGTFLVGALRYLSYALKESFEHHVLPQVDPGQPLSAPLADEAQGLLTERLLEITRDEDERWEERLEAQLTRAVVENCIYGVDINPLAVEFAKLSLWIETMSPELRFTFLDHKLRTGNSLIGAWLHEYGEYPEEAWKREGYNEEEDNQIRRFRKDPLQTQLNHYEIRKKHDISFFEDAPNAHDLKKYGEEVFTQLGQLIDDEEKDNLWRKEFLHAPHLNNLRHLMDRWCAVWFWPVEDEVPILDPEIFYSSLYDETTGPIVERLSSDSRLRFFHWEVEFPNVFKPEMNGFDALLTNPPWEQLEANELEIYTRYDPAYPALDDAQRQEIQEMVSDYPEVKSYHRGIQNRSFFLRNRPPVGPVPLTQGETPKPKKRGETRGKVNLYREFLAQLNVLLNNKGRFGAICPSGILSDRYSNTLRTYLRRALGTETVDIYQNSGRRFFDIPPQNKFVCLIGGGGDGSPLLMKEGVPLTPLGDNIDDTLGWPEFEHQASAQLFRRISEIETVPNDHRLTVGGELNTTTDRRNGNYLEPSSRAECRDYEIPVMQGTTVERFDGAAKTFDYDSKSWVELTDGGEFFSNRYLNPERDYNSLYSRFKVAFKVTSKPQINPRSAIGAVMPLCSTVHTLGTVSSADPGSILFFGGIYNSYVYDFYLRYLLQSQSIPKDLLRQVPVPQPRNPIWEEICDIVFSINCLKTAENIRYPPEYSKGRQAKTARKAVLSEELDRLVMEAYGLTDEDMRWILRPDNDDPRNLWKDYRERLKQLGGRGYWGVLPDEMMDEVEGEQVELEHMEEAWEGVDLGEWRREKFGGGF